MVKVDNMLNTSKVVNRGAVKGTPIPFKKLVTDDSKMVIVGCNSAFKKINKLIIGFERLHIKCIYSVKEDNFCADVRRQARQVGVKTFISSVENYKHEYHDASAMAIADLMWVGASHFIAYWDGKPGLPKTFIEICLRMKKKLIVIEV